MLYLLITISENAKYSHLKKKRFDYKVILLQAWFILFYRFDLKFRQFLKFL